MKRLVFLFMVCLVLLVVLTAVLNAPRIAEARAHEAAAHAMQTQAIVTGVAVAGMLLLVALLALALVLVVGLFLWGMVTGRLAMVGQFNSQSFKQRRMQIHHASHPQLPVRANEYTRRCQLPVVSYETDQEDHFDWHLWETTPWEIEEPF